MLHRGQSFKREYSSTNFNFIISFQLFNVAIYVVVFKHLSNGTIRMVPG